MEIVSGPATLEEFLEGDLKRQTKVVAFMENAVEQMYQGAERPGGMVDFSAHTAAGEAEAFLIKAREKLHDIELAQSALKIGNQEVAVVRLNEAVEELREMIAVAYGEGRAETVEELNKQLVVFLMLQKDIEVE